MATILEHCLVNPLTKDWHQDLICWAMFDEEGEPFRSGFGPKSSLFSNLSKEANRVLFLSHRGYDSLFTTVHRCK